MTKITDAEWREFQNIPEQGYSHRGWVDSKIQERITELEAERDEWRRMFTECPPIHLDGVVRANVAEAERDKFAELIERARGWCDPTLAPGFTPENRLAEIDYALATAYEGETE